MLDCDVVCFYVMYRTWMASREVKSCCYCLVLFVVDAGTVDSLYVSIFIMRESRRPDVGDSGGVANPTEWGCWRAADTLGTQVPGDSQPTDSQQPTL